MTIDEKYYNIKPSVKHLRVFGSLAYVHVPDIKRSKLDSKTLPCILLGYDNQSKGYRLFDPHTKRIYMSRDVVVDENQMGLDSIKVQVISLEIIDLFPTPSPSSASILGEPVETPHL